MTRDEMTAEADRLSKLQREERGWHKGKDLDGKSALIPNRYEPTPEREARAAQIIKLRRAAA